MSKEVEIERKWLVRCAEPRSAIGIARDGGKHIRQVYFGNECRMRITQPGGGKKNTTAEMTVKLARSKYTRQEFNFDIPIAEAEEIWTARGGLAKDRWKCRNGFTLDQFQGKLAGLWLLEKEYASEEEAEADSVPDEWMATDVTSITTFINSNLVGKMWDAEVGLLVDPGPASLAFGGEPFPPFVEYQLVTGDEEDIMPPPLVIP